MELTEKQKYMKEWRNNNPRQKLYMERFLKKNPNYYKKENPKIYDKKIFRNLRYFARKKGLDGTHTFQEWQDLKRKYNYSCVCCGKKESEIKLTEDHIVPMIKGGTDYIKNIQPLCSHCNSVKHMDIINYKLSFN